MPSATTSDYLTNARMKRLLKGEDFTAPTTLYIALYTTAPQLNGTGGTEVSRAGTSYSRVAVRQNTGWQGPSGSNQEWSNTQDIVFAVPTGNWGRIAGAGILDAETDGNLLWVLHMSSPKQVENGDGAPKIPAGALKISRAVC